MADDAILTVPIDVATALDILRAGTATVVLEADENGVQIRLPFTLALSFALSFAPIDQPREEADPPRSNRSIASRRPASSCVPSVPTSRSPARRRSAPTVGTSILARAVFG